MKSTLKLDGALGYIYIGPTTLWYYDVILWSIYSAVTRMTVTRIFSIHHFSPVQEVGSNRFLWNFSVRVNIFHSFQTNESAHFSHVVMIPPCHVVSIVHVSSPSQQPTVHNASSATRAKYYSFSHHFILFSSHRSVSLYLFLHTYWVSLWWNICIYIHGR